MHLKNLGQYVAAVGMVFVSSQASAQPLPERPTSPPVADRAALVITAARSPQSMLPSLEAADAAARSAEVAYSTYRSQVAARIASRVGTRATPASIRNALQPYERSLAMGARRYADAERDLTRARNKAWASQRISRQVPTLIKEPLELALFDLHLELRRAIGPTAHTVVVGLKTDTGCAGDLVADRLVYRYGQTVTSIAAGPEAHAVALGRIATQIACLSSKQLSHVETALSRSHARVSNHLTASGLGDLVPAFTRHVAPLQVLLLDARKHRGPGSKSWEWFVANNPSLTAEVQRLGWPGGTLWLWDRLAGRMVGYPQCNGVGPRGACVDPLSFLASLADPRALGRGDCALAAMVSNGTTALPSGLNIYTCPSLPCEDSSRAGSLSELLRAGDRWDIGRASTGPAPTPAAQNNLPWPQLTQADIEVMRGFCVMPGAGSRQQGAEKGDCFFANRAKNPFDNYMRCRMRDSADQPLTIGEFGGVPMSPECKYGSGGGEEEETPPASAPAAPPSAPANPTPAEKEFDLGELIVQVLDIIVDFIVEAFGGEVASTANDLLSEEGADAELGAGQMLSQQALRDAWFDGRISDQEYFDSRAKKPGEIGEFLKNKKGAQSCVDPLDCSTSCTGLGQSLATMRACTTDLMNDLLTAAGRPRRDQPVKRPDWVSNWHPDQAPVPESDFCLTSDGSTAPARGSLACGLVMCPDGGTSASPTGECCGSRYGSLSVSLIRSSCLTLNCPDGVPAVDASGNCSCASADPSPTPGTGGTGPGPDPQPGMSSRPRR